uniref:Alkaline phosphatase n=1 Tax=Kryptolebias marmoratus TaxID=37003 RepID=A0A3Q3AUF9_KRYMA
MILSISKGPMNLGASLWGMFFKVEEENPDYWRSQARETLQSALDRKLNTNVAKNILFFLGDGMGVTTYTAARILKGQLQNQSGEDTVMTMDTFPHVGLAKTYSVDFQIPDSAATATAYLCGVKTNLNVIGVNAAARNGVCRTQKGNEVTSILKWAKDAGKSVGVVTTTRVQHATPATTYAHSASRKWYSDADMPDSAKKDGCTDIASQLIKNIDIDVIIGGGRKYMTPRGTKDPEYPWDFSSRGKRRDGRNLIQEWQSMKTGKVTPLFNKAVTQDPILDPSIVETTEKAIRILQKNPKGFFLLVEGGRIDQAHHAGQAYMALHEAIAFDKAIAKGLELTKDEETLTIVTADHSQPLTFNGFPFRGQSILGKSPLWATDMLPYTTLMYGNGPGNKIINGKRPDIRNVTTNYIQFSAVPMKSTTHSGEDVAVLARGPMAHLFSGVQEQNYIAHAMAYAACVGTDMRHCQSESLPPLGHSTFSTDWNGSGVVQASAALISGLLSLILVLTVLM